ncbi:hypothetical protein PAXINDRAFT_180727 [Paxillus involutus ATCC 200175]|uniref:Uncharacterized protein n=1 Tax=Paxillus involutus ATCC 200175 TaxID=664439 RepID=A0A0C9THB7_PAXIN|nr:hypothetical protein PAXINDRAFT_180727 [Paxillus involutus ATCC 200175]
MSQQKLVSKSMYHSQTRTKVWFIPPNRAQRNNSPRKWSDVRGRMLCPALLTASSRRLIRSISASSKCMTLNTCPHQTYFFRFFKNSLRCIYRRGISNSLSTMSPHCRRRGDGSKRPEFQWFSPLTESPI